MFKDEVMHDAVYYFELFYHTFNSMTDMVFLIQVDHNEDFYYLFANKAATKFIDIDQDSYGKRMKDFLPYPVFKFIKEKYEEAIAKKGPISYEEKVRLPFESAKQKGIEQIGYFESTVTPVFNEEGRCTHILAIVRDITIQKQKEKELKQVKEQFELIWNSTADATYIFDEMEQFVRVNDGFEKIFGWKREEILKDPTISIIPHNQRGELNQIIETVKNGNTVPLHEVQRVKKNGLTIDVLASYSPIYDRDGNWEGAVAVYKDITERRKIYRELEKSEERYRLITENTSDLIKVIDPKGMVLYASPSHLPLLGVNPEDTLYQSILTSVYPDDIEPFDQAIKKINQTRGPVSVDIRRLNKKGAVIWLQAIGTPVLDENNDIERIIFVARDITERMNYEEKLRRYALYDSLTGIPNRTQLYKKLKEQIQLAKATQSAFAVMMLDLDKFKRINDTMGHDIGDELLKGFSNRIKQCLRKQDLLARLGGDEFVVLIPDLTEKNEALELANRIINSLQENWKIGEYCFETTTSIGITFYPPYEQTHKNLLKQADLALYQAKEKGRNNFQIYQNDI